MPKPRETAAQKRTRIGMLLAEYDAQNRALRKLTAEVKTLKAQVQEIEPGTYGEWIRSHGTPREILDQPKARDLLKEHGIPVPMATTEAPIVVTFAPIGGTE